MLDGVSMKFPSNVRSLMATGMLDGVSVKYVSSSGEELPGVIKGSGYLCGCQSCNYSKKVSSNELARHAGCETKHRNDHIYFENGKTIHLIVLDSRSTPESLLFDAIQNMTGSPINQNAFCIWKCNWASITTMFASSEQLEPDAALREQFIVRD